MMHGKTTYSDRDLDRLLGCGRISGPERERILASVQRHPAVAGPWRSMARLAARQPVMAAAAVVALVLGAMLAQRQVAMQPPPMQARGAGSAPLYAAQAMCERGCRVGANLMFRVEGAEGPAWVAAYAEGPDGRRIWYFPDDSGVLLHVNGGAAPVFLDRAVRLGTEHPPGAYDVHVVFLNQPLSRGELLTEMAASVSAKILARSEQSLQVAP